MAYYNSQYIEITGTVTGYVAECADPSTLRLFARFDVKIEKFKRMKGAMHPRDVQRVVAGGRLGAYAADTLKDGDRIMVSGEIQNGRYGAVVDANKIILLERLNNVRIPEEGTQISLL